MLSLRIPTKAAMETRTTDGRRQRPRIWLSTTLLAVLAGPLTAQRETPTLERAALLLEQEHDLDGALAEYRRVLSADGTDDAVRAQGALGAGKILLRLGRGEEAARLLDRAVALDARLAGAVDHAKQQPQERQRDEALLEKARELIGQFDDWEGRRRNKAVPEIPGVINQGAAAELIWIGEAAMPAIQSAFRSADATLEANEALNRRLACIALAWHIGGRAAMDWLLKTASTGSLEDRRLAALGASVACDQMIQDVVPVYLRDGDPEGVVPARVLGLVGYGDAASRDGAEELRLCFTRDGKRRYTDWKPDWRSEEFPADAVILLAGHENSVVRHRALQVLCDWGKLRHLESQTASFAALEPLLVRSMRSAVRDEAQQAWYLLYNRLWWRTEPSRDLAIRMLPEWPVGIDVKIAEMVPAFCDGEPALEAHCQTLGVAAAELGARTGNNSERKVREGRFELLLKALLPPLRGNTVSERGMRHLLRVRELGYTTGYEEQGDWGAGFLPALVTVETYPAVMHALGRVDESAALYLLQATDKFAPDTELEKLDPLADRLVSMDVAPSGFNGLFLVGLRRLCARGHPASVALLRSAWDAGIRSTGLANATIRLAKYGPNPGLGDLLLEMWRSENAWVMPDSLMAVGEVRLIDDLHELLQICVDRESEIRVDSGGPEGWSWNRMFMPAVGLPDGASYSEEQLRELWSRFCAPESPVWLSEGLRIGQVYSWPAGFFRAAFAGCMDRDAWPKPQGSSYSMNHLGPLCSAGSTTGPSTTRA